MQKGCLFLDSLFYFYNNLFFDFDYADGITSSWSR